MVLYRTGAAVQTTTRAALDDMRLIERSSVSYADATLESAEYPAGARIQYTGARILFLFDPMNAAASEEPIYFGASGRGGAASNGFLRAINISGTTLRIQCQWNAFNSENNHDLTWPTNPIWVEIKLDLTNATAADRMQVRTWEYGASIPETLTSSNGFITGDAATDLNWTPPSQIHFFYRDATTTNTIATGPIWVDDDPTADLSTYTTGATGPTFTVAPTVTARTTNSYTIGGTMSEAGEVYAVAVLSTDTAPTTEAQIVAGNNGDNTAARGAGNGTADSNGDFSFNITGTNLDDNVTHNIHVVGRAPEA